MTLTNEIKQTTLERFYAKREQKPKQVFQYFREQFYNFLSNFENWEEYKEDFKKNKYNRDYLPELLFSEFKKMVYTEFMEKYPFLMRYSEYFPQFENYKRDNNFKIVEIFSDTGNTKIRMELSNIKEEELYFPNIKRVFCCHSSLHSITQPLKFIKSGNWNGDEIILYDWTQIAHSGDKEYIRYFAEKMKIPLVVLTRTENTSFNLQINGVPKIGKFGRYCTRIWKLEPSEIFYRNYFNPTTLDRRVKFLATIKELKEICIENDIIVPKPLVRARKGELVSFIHNSLVIKGLIPKETPKQYLVNIFDQDIKLDNIVQFIGINKYQSTRRSKMNPNLKVWKKSNPRKGFIVYQTYPVFHESFEELMGIFNSFDLERNPYELEYEDLDRYWDEKREYKPTKIQREREQGKEVRQGCSICPYKYGKYYCYLEDYYPLRFYFGHFIRTIASARSIFNEDREYYYFDEDHTPKREPQLKFKM